MKLPLILCLFLAAALSSCAPTRQAGGGFVGIHSMTGTDRQWSWFKHLVGGAFVWHVDMQRFQQRIVDRDHPSTGLVS